MGNKPRGAHDGARHQLREKGHKETEVCKALNRLHRAEIDVQSVAHGLEGKERDAHGQEDVIKRQVAAQLVDGVDNEIGVFEIAQRA